MKITHTKEAWGFHGTDVVIFVNAGAPADGEVGTGTGAGFAGKGSLCLDSTNGLAYVNGGTKASPVWKTVTQES